MSVFQSSFRLPTYKSSDLTPTIDKFVGYFSDDPDLIPDSIDSAGYCLSWSRRDGTRVTPEATRLGAFDRGSKPTPIRSDAYADTVRVAAQRGRAGGRWQCCGRGYRTLAARGDTARRYPGSRRQLHRWRQ